MTASNYVLVSDEDKFVTRIIRAYTKSGRSISDNTGKNVHICINYIPI